MMTQKTLQQILDVLKYFRFNYQSGKRITASYQEAIDHVADDYGVTYQTIGDGCRRRLELKSIDEFREMLREWVNGDPKSLIRILKLHTSNKLYPKIDSFFQKYSNGELLELNSKEKIKDKEEKVPIRFEMRKSDQRYLRALSEIEGKDEEVLIESIISDGIKDRMRRVVNNLK